MYIDLVSGDFFVKKTTQKLILLILILAAALICMLIFLQPRDGWQVTDGSTQYILDGKPVTGWQEIDGNRYYFSADGNLTTGWQQIGDSVYYFGTDGCLVTGWLKLDGSRFYLGTDGVLHTGWQEIEGSRYYFNEDGSMNTGILIEDGAAYLFNGEGKLSTGWVELDGKSYYGDESGHPLYGWVEIDGRQHYFDETGAAAVHWVQLDGISYYFYNDGAPAQGKVIIDGQPYFFGPSGQHLPLVNPWNPLPEGYTVELVPISETHQIAKIAYQDYLDMMADCEAAGHFPAVCSSYRTQEYQEKLYRNRIDRYLYEGYPEDEATVLAGRSVAVPGTSEHQLGLALDLVDNRNWHLDESQSRMPTQIWLMENSWRYGWILRYPSEKSHITGIIYEPWHYRYVGKAVAKQMHELGLCLEEYLDMLTNSVG